MQTHDTQTEAKINLARRAVACPGWRWMPGMRDVVDGDRAVAVASRGQALWVRWAKAGEAFRDEGHRWLPDLDDPATLGCLLALVRAKWASLPAGPRMTITASAELHVDGWRVVGPVASGQGYETEAEALVAALEAAP